ncbi:unnamed protein product, partial [Symbiodinium necroappetens]
MIASVLPGVFKDFVSDMVECLLRGGVLWEINGLSGFLMSSQGNPLKFQSGSAFAMIDHVRLNRREGLISN